MFTSPSYSNNILNQKLKDNWLKSSNYNFDGIERNDIGQNLDLPNIDLLKS